jgi:hypothetical protein
MEETFMTRWFVPAALAVILTCGGPLAISPAAAASAQATAQQASTGLTARRHDRRDHRHVYHPYYRPYYYDRPRYYAPAPVLPLFGLGYGPWW